MLPSPYQFWLIRLHLYHTLFHIELLLLVACSLIFFSLFLITLLSSFYDILKKILNLSLKVLLVLPKRTVKCSTLAMQLRAKNMLVPAHATSRRKTRVPAVRIPRIGFHEKLNVLTYVRLNVRANFSRLFGFSFFLFTFSELCAEM